MLSKVDKDTYVRSTTSGWALLATKLMISEYVGRILNSSLNDEWIWLCSELWWYRVLTIFTSRV